MQVEIVVAWGDMDAYGHVNNAVFLRWFETARIKWFELVELPVVDLHRRIANVPRVDAFVVQRASCRTGFVSRFHSNAPRNDLVSAGDQIARCLLDFDVG